MILLRELLTGSLEIPGEEVGDKEGMLNLPLLREMEFVGLKWNLVMPLLEGGKKLNIN